MSHSRLLSSSPQEKKRLMNMIERKGIDEMVLPLTSSLKLLCYSCSQSGTVTLKYPSHSSTSSSLLRLDSLDQDAPKQRPPRPTPIRLHQPRPYHPPVSTYTTAFRSLPLVLDFTAHALHTVPTSKRSSSHKDGWNSAQTVPYSSTSAPLDYPQPCSTPADPHNRSPHPK